MRTYQAVAAAFLASSVDARLWFGACPKVDWMSNFDSAAFAGQWYEQERDAVFAFSSDTSCSTGNYVLNSEGTLDVVWRAYYTLSLGGLWQYGSSPPGVMDCSESSNCEISMAKSDKTTNWGILATDYDNWHAAYWCGSLFGVQYSWLGIYGKSEQLSDEHKNAAEAAV